MIGEIICHRMGWSDLWYAHPGPRGFTWLWPGRWHAGVWTGPQFDLICVKKCATNEEAEVYLSPPAPTMLLACLRARWKAWRLGVEPGCRTRLAENEAILAERITPDGNVA